MILPISENHAALKFNKLFASTIQFQLSNTPLTSD